MEDHAVARMRSGQPGATKRPRVGVGEFTDLMVRKFKPTGERRNIWGPGGMVLRLSGGGDDGARFVRTWCYVFRNPQDPEKHVWMRLGTYPDLTVKAARRARAVAAGQVANGINPAKQARRTGAPPDDTVAGLIEAYLTSDEAKIKKSRRDQERLLREEIGSRLGKMKLADVRPADVRGVYKAIIAKGHLVTANRTLSALSAAYRWKSEDNEDDGLDGLDNPCAPITRRREKPKERYLSMKEIGVLLRGLEDSRLDTLMGKSSRLALQMILATGQRPGEVAGARWDEIDEDAGLWRIPGARRKNGHPNAVPLSPFALALLVRTRALNRDGPYLFPGQAKDPGPMRPLSLATAVRRSLKALGMKGAPFTPHDLRASFATHLKESGCEYAIVARLLGHGDPSVTGRYLRSDFMPQMRTAVDAWGEQLARLGKEQAR